MEASSMTAPAGTSNSWFTLGNASTRLENHYFQTFPFSFRPIQVWTGFGFVFLILPDKTEIKARRSDIPV
jgi:hypothetical protein